MRFQTTVDIWSLSESQVASLQVGQWVSAGKIEEGRQNCGRFCGVKKSGSVVVAWNGNAKNHHRPSSYVKNLMSYAKSN